MKILKNKPLLIIGAIILLIGVIAGIYFYQKEESARWIVVKSKIIEESFTVSGNINAKDKSNINAPLTGTLVRVLVNEGDNVLTDTVLAIYEKDAFIAQLNEAQSQLSQAQANYNKLLSGNRAEEISSARAEYNQSKLLLHERELQYKNLQKDAGRYKTLHQKKMLTQQEYENYLDNLAIARNAYNAQKYSVQQAQNQYNLTRKGFRSEDIEAARSQVSSAQARIKEISTIYNKTEIRSPITGIIAQKYVETGDNVMAGDKLFYIIDKKSLEVEAKIEEEDLANVKEGDKVEIVADAYPREIITGRVSKIIQKIEEDTKLITVKIDIVNLSKDINLLPGMTVSCTFKGHPVKYLIVEKEAIQFEGKKSYLQTEFGKIYILIGKEHEGEVIIKGSVREGEKVLVE